MAFEENHLRKEIRRCSVGAGERSIKLSINFEISLSSILYHFAYIFALFQPIALTTVKRVNEVRSITIQFNMQFCAPPTQAHFAPLPLQSALRKTFTAFIVS